MSPQLIAGLRPEPLASYLGGLGLLRVLAEQADPHATAWWSDDGLVIDTTVDDIAAWLAERYVPTPVLSPWKEGSGFGEDDRTSRKILDELVASDSPRLRGYRTAIAVARTSATASRARGLPKKDAKEEAVRALRNVCPDELVGWIDACVVLTAEQARFPPLLGTGGNDGNFDFSTNFHQRILKVLDTRPAARRQSLQQARDLLSGEQVAPLHAAAVGQFDPASAGGSNSAPFGKAQSLVNPWAFVLTIEGSLLFAAGVTRRHGHDTGREAIPYTVIAAPDGSATGSDTEESRREVWVPLWSRPFTYPEIRHLFTEARASWRGRPARRAADFYAALATHGVTHGLDGFVRYSLHQRNGKSYVAVPVDRVPVRPVPAVRLTGYLDDWVAEVRRAAQKARPGTKQRPSMSAAVRLPLRVVDAAHLAFVTQGTARHLAVLLAAQIEVEMAVARSGKLRKDLPVRRPPPAAAFLPVLAEHESPELRIAAALASVATRGSHTPGVALARSMRHLIMPIDPDTRSGGQWRAAPVVPGFGIRPLRDVLADVLVWRCRTAADEPGEIPYRGATTFHRGVPAPAADLHAWATGQLNPVDLELWFKAFLALDWTSVSHRWAGPQLSLVPVPTLGLLQVLARGIAAGRQPAADVPRLALGPDWANRLAAGQLRQVHDAAARRLGQAGWDCPPAPPPTMCLNGRALAAALLPRCAGTTGLLRHLALPQVCTDDVTASPKESA